MTPPKKQIPKRKPKPKVAAPPKPLPPPERNGFPEGHAALEQTQRWYDFAYAKDKNARGVYSKTWWQMPHRTVTWYPALSFVNGRILEIGCGPGHFAHMCRQYGKEYGIGFDYSPIAIQFAKQNPALRGLRFMVADALSAKALLEDEPYDCVVILEVLEHVMADRAIIEAIPIGKTVVASVPDFHTEGHCRWFANQQQVVERYGDLLNIEVVVVEYGQNSSNRWFIFRGVRA